MNPTGKPGLPEKVAHETRRLAIGKTPPSYRTIRALFANDNDGEVRNCYRNATLDLILDNMPGDKPLQQSDHQAVMARVAILRDWKDRNEPSPQCPGVVPWNIPGGSPFGKSGRKPSRADLNG